MSQRNVTACDACAADNIPDGHAVITVSGERSGFVSARLPGGRRTLDLCDECAVALGIWLVDRAAPKPVVDPTVVVSPPAPGHTETPAHDPHAD